MHAILVRTVGDRSIHQKLLGILDALLESMLFSALPGRILEAISSGSPITFPFPDPVGFEVLVQGSRIPQVLISKADLVDGGGDQ